MAYTQIPGAPGGRRRFYILAGLILLVVGARTISSWVIEYQWWKEMGQVTTWLEMLAYGSVPVAVASLLAFLFLWATHARALKFAKTSLRRHKAYAWLSTLVLLLVGIAVAAVTIDSWTIIRFFGGRQLPPETAAWKDDVFGLPLSFYLFQLPFYTLLRRFLLAVVLLAAVIFWLAARAWQIRDQFPQWRESGEIDPNLFRLEGGLESRFLRGIGVLVLLAVALGLYLGRYELLWNEHGIMVGADFVDEKIRLPMQWLAVAGALCGAALIWLRRWFLAGGTVAAVLILRAIVPAAVSAAYVRPNEISLQREYVARHIKATRQAYGLTRRTREMEFPTRIDAPIDTAKHRPLLENVRLWDWRAFFDTVTQIQALRPYYVFPDADVDRYVLNGRLRQVLLTPRELDIRQLADARARWINPHFIYTHGYGVVMAEANRLAPDGLPILFVQDAPAQVKTTDLQLTRPEIYYGERVHEPVFVRTAQPEFNYPSGAENIFSRYEGRGGFPIASWPLRLAAAIAQGDVNILLTTYLTAESRMMIRRNVTERLRQLAGFVSWDPDPYLVLTDSGRLVFTVDGYTSSPVHPYSASINMPGMGRVNYIRNSVKATVDAYDGAARIYIFDAADPIVQAYHKLFPKLMQPAAAMPADLRRHARYPEALFRAQAEIYRLFHMQDPQAFYNKEDVWDIARNLYAQADRPEPVPPTFVVATLPGETTPEFLLIIPFTPRNKDNMIGLMAARCDGDHLGELVFLQLSKQELIFGPMQIEASINQDQNISKDLTLWNQQGSQVLRGQMLVLPVEDTFLYVEPLYIQASEARMPQLKKVVLATGARLIYRDTYEQALAELQSGSAPLADQADRPAPPGGPPPSQPALSAEAAELRQRLDRIRGHLNRYRELAAQGKWSEAGRELEAMDQEARR